MYCVDRNAKTVHAWNKKYFSGSQDYWLLLVQVDFVIVHSSSALVTRQGGWSWH